MTLPEATEEIRLIIQRGVDALRKSELYPPDQVSRYPIVAVFPASGQFKNAPPELMTGLHNIIAMLIYPLEPDLQQAFEKIIPLVDDLAASMWDGLRAGTIGSAAGANSVIQTWANITYVVGDREIGGVGYFVAEMTIVDVKVQTALA